MVIAQSTEITNQNVFVVGPVAETKKYATQEILANMIRGKKAIILDVGGGYAPLVEKLDGSIVSVSSDSCEKVRRGTKPCTLYEFGEVDTPISLHEVPLMEPITDDHIVLLSEGLQVHRRCPDLMEWLKAVYDSNAKLCCILHSMPEVDASQLPANVQVVRL